jgi:hypothetical protein
LAEEFYEQFNNKIGDWENFRKSDDNIYKVETLNDLIAVFGQERVKIFFTENSHRTNYFFEKHSAVTKRYSCEQVYTAACD